MTAPEPRHNPDRARRHDAALAAVVGLWLLVIAGLLVAVAALAFGGLGSMRLTWPTGPTGPTTPSAPSAPTSPGAPGATGTSPHAQPSPR